MCKKVKMVERKEISTGDCWSAGNIPGSPEGIATHNLLFPLCGKPYKTSEAFLGASNGMLLRERCYKELFQPLEAQYQNKIICFAKTFIQV